MMPTSTAPQNEGSHVVDSQTVGGQHQSQHTLANVIYASFGMVGLLFCLLAVLAMQLGSSNIAPGLTATLLVIPLAGLYIATFFVSFVSYRSAKKDLTNVRLIDMVMLGICLLGLVAAIAGYAYDKHRISVDTKNRCADLQRQLEEKKITGYYTEGCSYPPRSSF